MPNDTNTSKIGVMITQAKAALPELYKMSQQQVDDIVRVIAKVVHENAELLSEMAVKETRMGNVADKVIKCRAKSELIYDDLKSRKTVGIISNNRQSGIVEIAEPVGVVGALIPTTNPAVTAMSNAMFAIKGRNAIILSPHRRAYETIAKTMKLMNEVGARVGLPKNAIQMTKTPSRESTRELMSSVDVVLATGGQSMVKAAYESGKPSFGVGPGNVPVVIHETADIDDAVNRIIIGKAFDNGLICASEQAIFAPKKMSKDILASFTKQGAYIVNDDEKEALRNTMWVDEHINPDIVGQSAIDIAEMAGFNVPDHTKILLVRASKIAVNSVFSKEKLSPVLAYYECGTFEEATDGAVCILENGGLGHSAGIHCKDDEVATEFAIRMPASRVIVNQSTATTAGGSRENGLIPTTTMGCGSWGDNATSDNVTVDHVINIKRLAFKHAHLRDMSKIFN